MANFYYVKSGGTATGDAGRVATTRSTGSFATKGAAAYYVDLNGALAATTPPAAGDFIFVSDASADTNAGAETYLIPDGVQVWSVSDTNCDQYSAGASIDITSGATGDSITIDTDNHGWVSMVGFTFSFNGSFQTINSIEDGWFMFEDCTFIKANASGEIIVTGGGSCRDSTIIFKNCFIDTAHDSNQITNGGCTIIAHNLQPTGTFSKPGELFLISAGLGHSRVEVYDTNMADLVTTAGSIFGVGVGLDGASMVAGRCLLGASQSVISDALISPGQAVKAFSCSQTDGYHYFEYTDFFGKASEDTAQYLNATYDGTNPFSTLVITTAEASQSSYFRYKLCDLVGRDLSGASGETYAVELVSSDSGLTDSDVWIEIVHQDDTNQAQGILVSTRNADPLAVGTGLTSSSEVWNVTTNTEYSISQQITQKTNVTNAVIAVYVCVAKPSTTINFDPAIDVT